MKTRKTRKYRHHNLSVFAARCQAKCHERVEWGHHSVDHCSNSPGCPRILLDPQKMPGQVKLVPMFAGFIHLCALRSRKLQKTKGRNSAQRRAPPNAHYLGSGMTQTISSETSGLQIAGISVKPAVSRSCGSPPRSHTPNQIKAKKDQRSAHCWIEPPSEAASAEAGHRRTCDGSGRHERDTAPDSEQE